MDKRFKARPAAIEDRGREEIHADVSPGSPIIVIEVGKDILLIDLHRIGWNEEMGDAFFRFYW